MNILEQLYEGELNPADSVTYTDEYNLLLEKSGALEDSLGALLLMNDERELYNELLDIHNQQECEYGKISFCQGFSLATKIIMHSMGVRLEKPKDVLQGRKGERENDRIPYQELLMERCMDISSTLTDASNSYRKNSKQHIGVMIELQRNLDEDKFGDYNDVWCDLSYAISIPAYIYGTNLADGNIDWEGLEQRLDGLYASPRFQELWGRYGTIKEKLIGVLENTPSFTKDMIDKLDEYESYMQTEIRLESYLAVYLGCIDRVEIMNWLKDDNSTSTAEIEKWLIKHIPDIDLEMIGD